MMTTLKRILDQLDPDAVLIDNAGTEWDADNLTAEADGDCGEYVIDETGIWLIDDDGFRASTPAYRVTS